jgi:hypothetical protein
MKMDEGLFAQKRIGTLHASVRKMSYEAPRYLTEQIPNHQPRSVLIGSSDDAEGRTTVAA